VKAGILLAYKMDQMDNLHNSTRALVNALMLPNHAPAKAAGYPTKIGSKDQLKDM